jgi:hypothetical protein
MVSSGYDRNLIQSQWFDFVARMRSSPAGKQASSRERRTMGKQ